MKNKEKYAEQIIDIACAGGTIAVRQKMGMSFHVNTLIAMIVYLKIVIVERRFKNGQNQSTSESQ